MRHDNSIAGTYREVIEVLQSMDAPLRSTPKARPEFIYDQKALQSQVRTALVRLGWSANVALTPDSEYDSVRIAGVVAGSMKSGCHVVLEFGNRASWAHNLVSRVAAAHGLGLARLSVFVTPLDGLARQIDTNLASFERVAAGLTLLQRLHPAAIPGAVSVIGVDTDD